MKTNDRNSPNSGKFAFRTSRTAEHFPAGVPGVADSRGNGMVDGQSIKGGNLNSNSASIPPAIYMKTNDEDSLNSGEFAF